MDAINRTGTKIPTLQKLFFALSILGIPVGLAGIAGGVLLIVNTGSVSAAVGGSVVIFVGFCLATIPIGTSLIIFHLRLRCQGRCCFITKRYADLSKPRPKSFRNVGDRITHTQTDPQLAQRYAEVDEAISISDEFSSHGSIQSTEPKQVEVHYENVQESHQGTVSSQTKQKRRAPGVPHNIHALQKATLGLHQSPNLGKPVPSPMVPSRSHSNEAFIEEPSVAKPPDADTKTSEDSPSEILSTESQPQVEPKDVEISLQPELTSYPPQGISAQNELDMPPRNVSSLYPSSMLSLGVKYEEIGTKM